MTGWTPVEGKPYFVASVPQQKLVNRRRHFEKNRQLPLSPRYYHYQELSEAGFAAYFSQLYINLSSGEYETLAAAKEAGAATLNYGAFINVVIDFVIIAFAIFVAIKMMNAAKRKGLPIDKARMAEVNSMEEIFSVLGTPDT